jgi:hypothetical protein
MVNQLRNAFAHNPWRPKWKICSQKARKSYPIELDDGTKFTFDVTSLDGDDLKPDQVGGLGFGNCCGTVIPMPPNSPASPHRAAAPPRIPWLASQQAVLIPMRLALRCRRLLVILTSPVCRRSCLATLRLRHGLCEFADLAFGAESYFLHVLAKLDPCAPSRSETWAHTRVRRAPRPISPL